MTDHSKKTVAGSGIAYITRMNPEQYPDFMELAFREAERAFEEGEVPVGSVIVFDNKVIGRGYNRTEALKDPRIPRTEGLCRCS